MGLCILQGIFPHPLQKAMNKKMPQLTQEVRRMMTSISGAELQNASERGLEWTGDSLFFITSTCWRTASLYFVLVSMPSLSDSFSVSFWRLLLFSGAFAHMM